jgi:IclR family mhp operon transcriptional activator
MGQARLQPSREGEWCAIMDEAYSARGYGRLASAIGVPVLLNGNAIAALNLMYLNEAAGRDEIVRRFLPVLQGAAREVSDALAQSRGRTTSLR